MKCLIWLFLSKLIFLLHAVTLFLLTVCFYACCFFFRSNFSWNWILIWLFETFMSLLTGYNWIIFFFLSLQLFLGIIICMMSLHMYFAPPNMLLDMPLTVKPDEEERLIEVSVDRRTHSWCILTSEYNVLVIYFNYNLFYFFNTSKKSLPYHIHHF